MTVMLGPFSRLDSANPILGPSGGTFACPFLGETSWEDLGIFNPAAIVRDGKVFLLFRAAGSQGFQSGINRLGLAWSSDGVHFTRHPEPVLFPEPGPWQDLEFGTGLQDPRLVETEDSDYLLTYALFNFKNCYLAIATSPDLLHWKKHGLAFADALQGKYRETWSKAGAIVCRREGERLVATRINGKYWMYWGESEIYAATSDDLLTWTPLEMEVEARKGLVYRDGQWLENWQRGRQVLRPVLQPRRARFDSALVEPGPAALLTEQGILLIYNGCNAGAEGGDPALAPGAYSAGQLLFDLNDPASVIWRAERPFLIPERPFELEGAIPNVCFANGLVYFQDHWLLYYGAADRYTGVCVI